MPWSVVLALLLMLVVLLALRAENRRLTAGRDAARRHGRVPPPNGPDLLRAALLPWSRVRFWGGLFATLWLAGWSAENGTDVFPAMGLLITGVLGSGFATQDRARLYAGHGPDDRIDPWPWQDPQPEHGTLWDRRGAALGVLAVAICVPTTVWWALRLEVPEPFAAWWDLAALLPGLAAASLAVWLLRLAFCRVRLSGSWIRAVHGVRVTHVPVEHVVWVEGRALHLSDGQVVRTGFDLDTGRVSRFVEHTRAGLRAQEPREILTEVYLSTAPALVWTGTILMLAG